jgi:hypothetical protein
MAQSVSSRVQRAYQEDTYFVGVSTAASGIAVPLHCIQDALKADPGRGSSSLIGMGLEHQRCLPSTDARVGTLGLDRVKHAINKDSIQERGQGVPLSHTAVHSQRRREVTSKGYPGRAHLIEGINEASHHVLQLDMQSHPL